jgi:hypothetical protein
MLFFKRKKSNKKEEIKKNILQNPKILEVNLIRDEVRISFDWNKNLSILMAVLFVVGIFVVEIYFGLNLWEKQELVKIQALSDDITTLNREMSNIKSKADEALAFKDKSIELGRLLNEHIYWSNFFNWLEKNTLSTVKYDGFSGNTNGTYSLNARALSYAEVSWQVKAFLNDPIVKKVEVLSVNSALSKDKEKAGETGVSFSLSFELNPEVFKK